MGRAKTTGSLGGFIIGALILMFPAQFTSFLGKFADIFGDIVGNALLKALGF